MDAITFAKRYQALGWLGQQRLDEFLDGNFEEADEAGIKAMMKLLGHDEDVDRTLLDAASQLEDSTLYEKIRAYIQKCWDVE